MLDTSPAGRFIKNKYIADSHSHTLTRIYPSDTWDGAGVDAPATHAGAIPHAAFEPACAVRGALGRLAPRRCRNHRRASVLEVIGPNCLARHAACRYFTKSLELNTSTEKSAKKHICGSTDLQMIRRGRWLGTELPGWSSYLASIDEFLLVLVGWVLPHCLSAWLIYCLLDRSRTVLILVVVHLKASQAPSQLWLYM
jgi:hypothetical protein